MKIKAKESGLFLEIEPESKFILGANGIASLSQASTFTITIPGPMPNSPSIFDTIDLSSNLGLNLRFPKGLLKRTPNPFPEIEWNIIPGENGEHIPMSLKATERFSIKKEGIQKVELDELQKEILASVKKNGGSGIIEAAMGGGKSWLLLALVLGHPLLRPAAISGKGQKDTKQLLDKLKILNEQYPEYAEPIILSGLGRQLSKKDKKILDNGEGIVICTHAGLQNLPENTKLLVMDEVHAAATPNRIRKILALPNLIKSFGLTGTIGLRGDGGDQLIHTLIGPIIASKKHREFESTGRVAPAQINAYHFHGKGIYAENPFIPDQAPQEGYSTHATWVENHHGRHNFLADLILYLPHNETKVIFVPHIIHAVRIRSAIERKIHERLGDLTFEERENFKPILFHASTDKKEKYFMEKEERERLVGLLEKGTIKLAISTDFLSTGFDTNMIDHVIDASGQKAIIYNIQRSGRGGRARIKKDGSIKINQIHTVLDKTHGLLHKLGEMKFSALCAYYGHQVGVTDPTRLGGTKVYQDPPWIKQEERENKLGKNKAIETLHSTTPSTFDPKNFRKKS